MSKHVVTRCNGEGLSPCTLCTKKVGFNRHWHCMLFSISGIEGLYCSDCAEEILSKLDKDEL